MIRSEQVFARRLGCFQPGVLWQNCTAWIQARVTLLLSVCEPAFRASHAPGNSAQSPSLQLMPRQLQCCKNGYGCFVDQSVEPPGFWPCAASAVPRSFRWWRTSRRTRSTAGARSGRARARRPSAARTSCWGTSTCSRATGPFAPTNLLSYSVKKKTLRSLDIRAHFLLVFWIFCVSLPADFLPELSFGESKELCESWCLRLQ